jgi:hypothetical protein
MGTLSNFRNKEFEEMLNLLKLKIAAKLYKKLQIYPRLFYNNFLYFSSKGK